MEPNSMTDELETFKKKYQAHVQEGHIRYAVPNRMNMGSLLSKYEPFDLNFEYERSVQINMSERDFEQLICMEKYWAEQLSLRDINQSMRDTEQFAGHAKSIVENHESELRIRNKNPAAKIAYEKYRNLLSMMGSYYD